ncbi:GRAM domain-containing protein 1B-like [Ctenocephalides felis]|uniref:GRAM domain-containing protein 1B-like n=1 Tax=Ctenocephalides felis TaxID=7515 RepID=UPI000E6E4108|nr:GRAM domain-containing protein 1B-like [Ctenocephalides felis]
MVAGIDKRRVAGQSFNQALAFSGAMAASAPPQTSPLAEHRRSPSPNLSPSNSPKARNRREHSRSDTHLFVPSNEFYNNNVEKTDGAEQDNISRSSDSSQVIDLSRSVSHESERGDKDSSRITKRDSRVNDRTKKKSSWYNVLYPNYKTRSEDFKRIFKDVPDDERLIVEYSCAMQKDILLQGRLYVSQNFLCFYANIFGWETSVSLKWREVTAITKEKTALVIPNAILVCTEAEKHFFTSFTARDKAHLMLFRVWQHALMDQPVPMQVMWKWVHNCYGDELGLTSDDEYAAPNDEEKLSSARLSVESFSEEGLSVAEQNIEIEHAEEADSNIDLSTCIALPPGNPETPLRASTPAEQLPTDLSDTTDSDVEKSAPFLPKSIICPAPHVGRQLVQAEFPIHVDTLFTLLFTGSQFLIDFHAARNTQDLVQGSWAQNTHGVKSRTVSLTVALTQPVGPKTSQVTETQVMLPCSKPGQLYSIDIDSVNVGIPYAASFYVTMHYCLIRTGDQQSSISVHAQIKYKKSVWSVAKGFIEKNAWAGLEDFFDALIKALAEECELSPNRQRKSRRRRRVTAPVPRPTDDGFRSRSSHILPYTSRTSSQTVNHPVRRSTDSLAWGVLVILVILVFLNAALFYKLWALEEKSSQGPTEVHVMRNPPQSHDEWLRVLQRQESLHSAEMRKWQRVLHSAIQLLRKTEQSLGELHQALQPVTPPAEIPEKHSEL